MVYLECRIIPASDRKYRDESLVLTIPFPIASVSCYSCEVSVSMQNTSLLYFK